MNKLLIKNDNEFFPEIKKALYLWASKNIVEDILEKYIIDSYMRNKEKKIQDIKIIETTEDYERGEIIIAYSFNGGK